MADTSTVENASLQEQTTKQQRTKTTKKIKKNVVPNMLMNSAEYRCTLYTEYDQTVFRNTLETLLGKRGCSTGL